MGEGRGSRPSPLPQNSSTILSTSPSGAVEARGRMNWVWGMALVDEAGGLEHGGQVPLDFAGPAAGEQGDGKGLRVQVMLQQKGSPVREGRQGFPKGVAHVDPPPRPAAGKSRPQRGR